MGGQLTDIFGNDIPYDKNVEFVNSTGVLAAIDTKTHTEFAREIPDDVKIALLPPNSSNI
jgi:hypothetical protein